MSQPLDASKDYYSLLELTSCETLTLKDIRTAYYRLARELHPDKTGGDLEAAEQFKKVVEAYEVLSDGGLKREYDEMRELATLWGGPVSGGSECFGYAGATGRSWPRRPRGMDEQRRDPGAHYGSEEPQEYEARRHHQQTPTPTPVFPANFNFGVYVFAHYYYDTFRERPFLKELRKWLSEAKDEVRKARVGTTVARVNLEKWGGLYLRTLNAKILEAELQERQEWEAWWKGELGRREMWCRGHQGWAKTVRAEMKKKKEMERKAKEEEREEVKRKAKEAKVEVVLIEDSDDTESEELDVEVEMTEGVQAFGS